MGVENLNSASNLFIGSEQNNSVVSANKLAAIHVLAGLIEDPLLFSDNNYRFEVEDFPERFHKIVFAAIKHLAESGMAKISYIDIDQLLKGYPTQYSIFVQNRGVEYIQHCCKIYQKEKFKYYYDSLKKYSLLEQMVAKGIDIKEIYDPDEINPDILAKKQLALDSKTVNDIILYAETKIIQLKEQFGSNKDMVENHAKDGLRELKERLKQKPDMGLPSLSPKLTTVLRGFRGGSLVIESSGAGFGKSRRANGEACHLAVPEYFDVESQKWVKSPYQRSVLVIETELEEEECQQMWMAFIAGVPESKIKDGKYTAEEEARIDHAIDLLEQSNLYFVSVTNYDVDDIVNIIKKYKQLHNVDIVFFDYLMETLKITASMNRQNKGQGMRTDQVLLAFTSALKDLAKTQNIFIWTATQLSGDFKEAKQLDASYLRSAKSIADKADAGYILMKVREQDKEVISQYCNQGFELEPNFVWHVYKVRAGSFQDIKIYINYDRGTCQVHDCFATDRDGKLIVIDNANVENILDATRVDPHSEEEDEEEDF